MSQATKILFNTWPGAFLKPGGGEIQLLESKKALEDIGYSIELYNQWSPQTTPDIFHQFSIARGIEHVIPQYKERGIKIATSPILWPPEDFVNWGEFYEFVRSIMNHSDIIFTNSNAETKYLARLLKIGEEKFHKTRNGINKSYMNTDTKDDFNTRYKLDFPYVLSVANIDRRKNTHLLVEACKNLDIPLVSVGHIRDNTYFNEFKDSYRRFISLGPIENIDLLKSAYQSCTTFALTSLCETPGIAALEAASQGANIVITREGATEEYFTDYAEYVDPLNLSDIQLKIEESLSKKKNDRMKKHIVETYSWQQTAEDLNMGYQKLLK